MSVRRRASLGDPRLKAINKEVTDFGDKRVTKVIGDLIDTMHAVDLIGVAAPQIGENWQIFVTEPRRTAARPGDQTDELRVYINPKIVYLSEDKSIIYEGGGSVPGNIFGPVERPKLVVVEAYDRDGQKFQMKADGILGRVIQHEMDHLLGVEYIEKVQDYRKLLNKRYYYKNIKYSSLQTQASIITIREFTKL